MPKYRQRPTFAIATFILLVVAVQGLARALQGGRGADPNSRLLREPDLVHVGSFTLADTSSTCWVGTMAWEYVHGVIAFNPVNQSLFMVGHGVCQQVAEFKVPSDGGVAPVLHRSRDVLDGRLGDINPSDPNSKAIGGLLVLGSSLVVSAYSTYDAGVTAIGSHFVRSADLDAVTTARGPFRVGSENPAFYAGYLAPIPPSWQVALGGDVLTGQCCLSIISRTSFGPSVSVVSSADLLAAHNSPRARMLVGYPSGHTTLGDGDRQSAVFSLTTQIRGVALPDGTSSLLFFGLHGAGPFCYGEVPAECRDPSNRDKGGHAYPYLPQVWAYDMTDVLAVRSGKKRPWDIRPYATWRLPGVESAKLGGVAVDVASGRIFVTEVYGDGLKPRVHVFAVRTSKGDDVVPARGP